MSSQRRRPLRPLLLLATLAVSLSFWGCVSPWRNNDSDQARLTPEQQQWWAANSQRAEFLPGQGWRVPGVPGFFDESGRPLPPTAEEIAAAKTKEIAAAVPLVGEPASDLTPEQAQWWRTNCHLANWIPGFGFFIAGVNGSFDAAGHLTPRRDVAQVSMTTPIVAGPAVNGGANAYFDAAARGQGMSALDADHDPAKHQPDKDDSLLSYLPWTEKIKPSEPDAQAAKVAADAAFQARHWSDAAEAYAKVAALWPKSNLAEDSLFMRGESFFFADLYPKAFDAYEELLAKYKRSRHLEKAVAREFAIGQYWFELDRTHPLPMLEPNLTDSKRPMLDTLGSALKAMEKVRLNDPTGPLADDSLMATANSYFTRGRYEDADYYYTELRREYPKSEHQYDAHLLGIQAKVRSYQGASYESKPLKGADELVDQTLLQFRLKLPLDERQRLLKIKEQLTMARAQRDWNMAQYYEQQEYYGAARFYYQQLAKNYPGTQVARAATEHAAQLEGKPAVPPPRLALISWVIPEPVDPHKITPRLPAAVSLGPAPTPSPVIPQVSPDGVAHP